MRDETLEVPDLDCSAKEDLNREIENLERQYQVKTPR